MLELFFAVEGAHAERFAASPLIGFQVRIECKNPDVRIHNVMLHGQIRIEAGARAYQPCEQDRLTDLFGEPGRWARSLHSLLWTHAVALVPAFERSCLALLPAPCSFDFNVAATKYFHALQAGDVPLALLFSGSVFYDAGAGLQIAQIASTKEVAYRLPVQIWRDMMSHYYPNSAWLCLPSELLERLRQYKQRHGMPTWEHALAHLLAEQPLSAESAPTVEPTRSAERPREAAA